MYEWYHIPYHTIYHTISLSLNIESSLSSRERERERYMRSHLIRYCRAHSIYNLHNVPKPRTQVRLPQSTIDTHIAAIKVTMSDTEEALAVQVESENENEAIVATVIDEVDTDDEDEDVPRAPSEQEESDAEITTETSTIHFKDVSNHAKNVDVAPRDRKGKGNYYVSNSAATETTPAGTESKGRKRKLSLKKENSDEIPSIKNLGIPFRAVKRIMKVDKDIGTVQNEAAMVATYAAELFLEKLVKESDAKAKKKGRNTVKYEDLGEVRASHSKLSFLDTLIP